MKRLTLLATLLALGAATPAAAAPILDLDIHHEPTHFEPPHPGSVAVQTTTQGSPSPAANEVQEITVIADQGSFTLSFEGETTAELKFNATNKKVREGLEALAAIGAGNVKVPKPEEEGSTRAYTVEFQAALAATDVPQIEAAGGSEALTAVPAAVYHFDLRNVGDQNTSGTVTLTLQLPPGGGLGFAAGGGSFRLSGGWTAKSGGNPNVPWSCAGTLPGASTITCAIEEGFIPRHTLDDALFVRVAVDPAAAGSEPIATATASGGGAPNVASATEPTAISAVPASFGILAPSFQPDFLETGGSSHGPAPVRGAGAHPELLVFPFDFNSAPDPAGGAVPAGNIRDASVDLPPGFLGNPSAVGECPQALFTLGECPASAQVGRIDAKVTGFPPLKVRIGIFNLLHPRGVVSDIAFAIAANPVHVKASLDPATGYAVTTATANINETLPPLHQRLTFWGVPAAHGHDSERCQFFKANTGTEDQNNGDTSKECTTDHEERPFLTVSSGCGATQAIRIRRYDSWQQSGAFGPAIERALPGAIGECSVPRFEPSVRLVPTGHEANTPTGLDVHIEVPQNENPNARATPPIRSTTVTLPKGMVLNPAFADGLEGCSEAQFGISGAGVPNGEGVACPDASRIGEVEITTPLLPRPVEGSMYLAKQGANPFGSLFAVYLAAHDTEDRGVLVKIAGKLSLDPLSGQITQTFEDLPQLPFEDLTLKFRSGDRAPLVNPPTCGRHTIAVKLASYAQPDAPLDASNSYTVDEGPGGAPCAGSEAARPFNPRLSGGTLNPLAGAYSPLSLRVSRSDADQEIATVQGSAPAGLSASLRGVSRCPEAQIALARSRSAPGEGQLERRSPACPSSSQVGTVLTGAGAGPAPIYVPGKVYLAGPYEGAPLSGVAVVPAIAGPVDLGTIVVRAPAYVDPRTAQVRIASDPLPQIVHGVLVRVRDVRVNLDRPGFTLNPTSCAEKSLGALLGSTAGALSSLSQRFQVGDCANLGFKPRLGLTLRGGTRRGAHPALEAVVTPRPGDANFAAAVVTLPHSAFLDQAHIRTVCTRVQFAAGAGNGAQCPAGAVYGHAKAWSPLLDEPFEGPALLRSSSHKLPDLVLALHGPPSTPIEIELASRIDSIHGGIRSSFEAVPDVPVSRFVLEMQGGRKGLIVNSTDLCAAAHRAIAKLSGQNGRLERITPAVGAAGCAGARKGRGGRSAKG